MELIKKHKMHILLPVILVVITLIGSLLFASLQGGSSAARHCTLGQQYLNDLDYAAAILEFSNAITLDPTNTEARVGLSQAYSLSGQPDFAAQVLQDVLDENRLDPDLAEALIDNYVAAKKYNSAVRLVSKLIDQTDDERYYERLRELLQIIYSDPHPYSVGTDHWLLYRDSRVQSMGYNTLGQLGTTNDLGLLDSYQPDFANAMFPGTAKSVYCAGRTSYVVDVNNNLWAAGENRWGQMGLSYGTTLPEGGWVQLTDSGDVARVGGTNGVMFVLKYDGSLWQSGADVGQQLELCREFDTVLRLSSYNGTVYVLTGEGKLYSSYYDNGFHWSVVSNDVTDFTVSSQGVIWLNSDGCLNGQYGFSVPDTWLWMDDGSIKPSFCVERMAANGNVTLFVDSDGKLLALDGSGYISEVTVPSAVISLYAEQNTITAALEDGTVLVWSPYESNYTTY